MNPHLRPNFNPHPHIAEVGAELPDVGPTLAQEVDWTTSGLLLLLLLLFPSVTSLWCVEFLAAYYLG